MTQLETIGRERGIYWTATDLMTTDFPEPRWAVPGLLCEGLNLLVGSPKLGKSWLCLGLGVAIASGGVALGKIHVEEGDVLYAALEDTPRRLQGRLRTVLGTDPVPENLTIVTALPKGQEAIDLVGEWLDAHPRDRRTGQAPGGRQDGEAAPPPDHPRRRHALFVAHCLDRVQRGGATRREGAGEHADHH